MRQHAGCGHKPCVRQVQRFGRQMAGRSGFFRNPAARALGVPCSRAHAVHQIGAVVGVSRHAGVYAFQPMIPPAQRFLQKTDARFGHREMRIFVNPWPHNAFGIRQRLDQLGDGVFIGIAPATDGKNPRFDI